MKELPPALALLGAWLSGAALALIGVDWYALVWAFAGGLVSMMLTPQETRRAMLVQLGGSTLVGAGTAGAIALHLGGGRPVLIAAALIAGAGAKVLMMSALGAVRKRIEGLGGATPPNNGSTGGQQ